jgi:hypothetical protein
LCWSAPAIESGKGNRPFKVSSGETIRYTEIVL